MITDDPFDNLSNPVVVLTKDNAES